jgi:hypothetical protein
MYSAAETETSIDSSWICGQLSSSASDKHAEEPQIRSLSELRCGGMASRFLSILEVGWWDGGVALLRTLPVPGSWWLGRLGRRYARHSRFAHAAKNRNRPCAEELRSFS